MSNVKMYLRNETLDVVERNVPLMERMGWRRSIAVHSKVDDLPVAPPASVEEIDSDAANAAAAEEFDQILREAAGDEALEPVFDQADASDDVLTPEQVAQLTAEPVEPPKPTPARRTRKRAS